MDLFKKFLRINVAVFCIVVGNFTKIEHATIVYVFEPYHLSFPFKLFC
jgi:hypothetical protein